MELEDRLFFIRQEIQACRKMGTENRKILREHQDLLNRIVTLIEDSEAEEEK